MEMPVKYADETVSSLTQCIYHGGNFLSTVPGLVKIILGKNKDGEVLWRERYCSKVQGVVAFSSFTEFVTASPPRGLGATVKLLRDICRDDTEALDLIDQASRNPEGRPAKTVSNVHSKERSAGNTRDRGLRMLRDHRPDLHEMVIKGVEVDGANGKKKKYTAHRAMVEAGFRKKTFTIPADVHGAAKVLRRRFGDRELRALRERLVWARLERKGDGTRHGGVVVDSGPITETDKPRDVPQEKWGLLMGARRSALRINLNYEFRCLLEFIDDAKVMYKSLGFESADDMIRRGYELSPEQVAIAVEWLRINRAE